MELRKLQRAKEGRRISVELVASLPPASVLSPDSLPPTRPVNDEEGTYSLREYDLFELGLEGKNKLSNDDGVRREGTKRGLETNSSSPP